MDDVERVPLLGQLAAQRRHVLSALEGLSDDDLRRPVLPSGWTSLGLVRHLTLGVERYWFHTVVGGVPLDYWPTSADEPGRPADWYVDAAEPAVEVIDAIATSDDVIAGLRLSAPPRLPEPWWDEVGMSFPDLRSIVLHALVDTAVHAGHLDAARELIDGRQHLVL